MKYSIRGMVRIKGVLRPFVKVVDAKSKRHAGEIVYAEFGRTNRVKRTLVEISEILEIDAKDK